LSQFLRANLDNFIVTQNLSLVYQIRDFGSGQILQPRQLYLSPGLAKIAPWWLTRRDYFLAKVPGLVSADGATNVYSLNRRAVSCKANMHRTLSMPGLCQRARKSFAARPCNRPVAAKHMLFCLYELHPLDNFINHNNSCLFTGTLTSIQLYDSMTTHAYL
jgi:hypothetical protein